MALKSKTGTTKGAKKAPAKGRLSSSERPSKPKKSSGKPAPKPTQQKTKSGGSTKKKPPHMRYTEKELKVPLLNGIRPAGIQKPVNAKKGKTFVDDKESMNTILALVMAEKEGNIESKMMRARQMEVVREARRVEAEKRTQSKKAGFEDRKQNIKDSKKRRHSDSGAGAVGEAPAPENASKKPRKRVSFG